MKETTIIKEIGSYKFSGFYESIFCNSAQFISYEDEDKGILKDNLNKKDIEVSYNFIDFEEYKKDICNKFMELYIDKIKEILPSEIINNNCFKFEINNNDSLIIDSPKYYNYRTDNCFIEIETNIKTLTLIKWYVLKLEGAKEYIIKHFTSCDGFISFISNNIKDWELTPINNYELNNFVALFDMLLILNDPETIFNIECETLEYIELYEYIEPLYYIDDIEYNYSQLIKKFGNVLY